MMKPTSLLKFLLAPILLCLPPVFSAAQENATYAKQSRNESGGRPDLDKLVDVGGHRLYIKCMGSGSPTIILEAGLGSSSKTWDKVMPEVSKYTRVCSYDRPNEGKSDPAPRPIRRIGSHKYIELRTGRQVVQDLHAILASAGVAGPYILVGHSLGGMYAILYADRYPQEAVGMVLVDSAHQDQIKRFEAFMTPSQAKSDHDSLEQNEEGADIDEIFEEVRAVHWHSNIPLYVLVHGIEKSPPADWSAEQLAKKEQAWRELQADHARRSPNSKLIIAEKSGHGIQNDQPELVSDAIEQVLNLARNKTGAAQGRE